jgi:hypothetical protein
MVDRHSLGWGVASVIRQLKSYATRFSDTFFYKNPHNPATYSFQPADAKMPEIQMSTAMC